MIDVKTAAKQRDVCERRIRQLCEQGRIPGAEKQGRDWSIPDNFVVMEAARIRPSVIEMEKPRKTNMKGKVK